MVSSEKEKMGSYVAKTSVIIVTYNSENVIFSCLSKLYSLNDDLHQVIVVDGASSDTAYLDEVERCFPLVELCRLKSNVGFGAANNEGYKALNHGVDYVLFLNPDAFVVNNLLSSLEQCMNRSDWSRIGVCTPLLLGYSLAEKKPTDRIDSAGIGCTWFGRFYDRGQGSQQAEFYQKEENVPAICGAFMFCRKTMLDQVLIDGNVFDEAFFMYKEDIELSLRVRRAGWELRYSPNLIAYHCRGWDSRRHLVGTWAIKHSLLNDWKIWKKGYGSYFFQSVNFLYLILKSLVVGGEIMARKFRNKRGS